MTLFDQRRLTNDVMKLDLDGLRRGYYSDKYFENIVGVMQGVARGEATPLPGSAARRCRHDLRGLTSAICGSRRRFSRAARPMRWSPGSMRRWR